MRCINNHKSSKHSSKDSLPTHTHPHMLTLKRAYACTHASSNLLMHAHAHTHILVCAQSQIKHTDDTRTSMLAGHKEKETERNRDSNRDKIKQ